MSFSLLGEDNSNNGHDIAIYYAHYCAIVESNIFKYVFFQGIHFENLDYYSSIYSDK